jgi:hypothetical protein
MPIRASRELMVGPVGKQGDGIVAPRSSSAAPLEWVPEHHIVCPSCAGTGDDGACHPCLDCRGNGFIARDGEKDPPATCPEPQPAEPPASEPSVPHAPVAGRG